MDEWSNPIKVPPLPETITTGGTGKVEYVAVSVTELATLRAENERLAKSLKEYKEAEESVSDAYLRIRALVKSYNTKPGGSDRFEVTEQAIKDLQNENERLKAKIGGPDYLLKLDTYEDTVRELMHELAVRERQAEILDEEWDGRHTVESALAQARLELDGKARITSLLSGRQQSEPSPDADLIAPNSIDDAPPVGERCEMRRCNGCGQIVQTKMTHHYIQSGHVTRNNDIGGSASFPPLVLCGELVKETTLARVDEIEEAYHSADNSKLVFTEVKP